MRRAREERRRDLDVALGDGARREVEKQRVEERRGDGAVGGGVARRVEAVDPRVGAIGYGGDVEEERRVIQHHCRRLVGQSEAELEGRSLGGGERLAADGAPRPPPGPRVCGDVGGRRGGIVLAELGDERGDELGGALRA